MSETEIRDYARARGFHPKTLERWLNWDPADRDALAALARAFRVGENHLRDLMDWLEEIALRDHVAIREVLRGQAIRNIETDPRLGRADKLKRIKEQVRRVRFPRLAATEDEVRKRIHALGLGSEIKISAAPGLEEGRIDIQFSAASREDFRRLAGKLAGAAEAEEVGEIFELLGGRRGAGNLVRD